MIASGNDGHLVGRKGIGLTTILAQCSGRCSCREQGGISTEETGTASSQTGQMLDDWHLQLTSIWLEWSKHLQMLRVLGRAMKVRTVKPNWHLAHPWRPTRNEAHVMSRYSRKLLMIWGLFGSGGRDRTYDQLINSQTAYVSKQPVRFLLDTKFLFITGKYALLMAAKFLRA
ncbi:MAG: hypothetical protein LJE62_05170, partial [Silicimonas sp.]|nr:hypothetical protein [Silicimonas sp.]